MSKANFRTVGFSDSTQSVDYPKWEIGGGGGKWKKGADDGIVSVPDDIVGAVQTF